MKSARMSSLTLRKHALLIAFRLFYLQLAIHEDTWRCHFLYFRLLFFFNNSIFLNTWVNDFAVPRGNLSYFRVKKVLD